MLMTKTAALTALAMLMAGSAAQAGDWFFEEFVAPYRQRIDGVTASAGDAKAVNGVTHIIDPWPRRVGDRRIPANGDRMVGAMQRYRGHRDASRPDASKLHEGPPPIGVNAPGGSTVMSK
jgi:hypothetical protein